MRFAGHTAVRYRRATVLYLAAIAVPTLVLLWLGVQSIRRQADAYDALRRANRRLMVDRAAQDLERVLASRAERALRDRDLDAVIPLLRADPSPARQRELRRVLSRVAARHPWVFQFFVHDGEQVVFPGALSPVPRTLGDLLAEVPAPERLKAAAAFARAEDLEQQGVAGGALRVYQDYARLPGSPALGALALLGASRAARTIGQAETARSTLRDLGTRYRDEYDLFHRPYALVSAVELLTLGDAETGTVVSDMHAGRWEVHRDQAAYFLARLGPGAAADQHASPLLRELALLRAVEQHLRVRQGIGVNDVVSFEAVEDGHHGGWYRRLTRDPPTGPLIGFVLDTRWLQEQLLPTIVTRTDAPVQLERLASGSRAVDVVRLQPPLSGFALRLNPADATAATPRLSDHLLLGAGTLGVLGVLLLGVALLVRDLGRETQVARLRSALVSGVSHQLRTPLTLIRLYGEMLSDQDDLTPAERRTYLDVITDESRRLTSLAERVLDFSRVEQGRKSYVFEEVALWSVLSPVLDAYVPHLRRLGFVVDIAPAPLLPPVRIDPGSVADALVSLLDNAVKYSGEKKQISVRFQARPGQVLLEVQDWGIGVDDGDLARIFEPYERGSRGSERGGYGLGLSLVRDMMQAHGGTVEVDSAPGVGSTFRLVFPA